ncbi:MopE-related protein, partial [Winogradskyella sp.]|nr:MopE-related protein [Winogradskyella sp.]
GQTWYIDADGDNVGGSSVVACARVINGFLLSELLGSGTADCNDSDPTINPFTVWYEDLDGDGYGNANTGETGCASTNINATQDNTDCNDGDPLINSGVLEIAGDGIDNNCDGRVDELQIGQFIGGGIVFWIDPTDNTRSLVCAYEDQSAGIQWYNGLNKYISFTETAIRTGSSNTKFITDYQGPTVTNYAAGIAKAYGTNNIYLPGDWYLPSKDALNEMYLNKTAINAALTALGGDILSGSYWSSSEVNSELAWGQSFADGNQGEYVKYFGGKVRVVREYPNYIGQIIDDGVVFYLTDNATTDLDGDGNYDLGLICAFSDYAGAVEWGCYGTDLTNVPNDTGNPAGLGTVIGDGMLYTNNILQWGCSTGSAAAAARSLEPNWFLPSAKELNEMYLNKATLELVPGFTAFSDAYWSSSEFDSSKAWYQYFPTGNQFNYYKGSTINVRAVRAF